MQSPDEIFDVVDAQNLVLGQATRAEVHRRQLRHRAVHVLLFNSAGGLLVQKRSATKDTFPGCYDSSASGHLDRGEDYLAGARRELREELGVDLPAHAFQKLGELDAGPETGWEFVWVYRVDGDFPVTPHPGEIERVGYMSRHQLEVLLAEHPETCAPAFRRIVKDYIPQLH